MHDMTGSLPTRHACLMKGRTIMSVDSTRGRGSAEPLAAFAELSRIMFGEKSLDETLGQIAALARDTIPDIDEVSVTLVDL